MHPCSNIKLYMAHTANNMTVGVDKFSSEDHHQSNVTWDAS